MKNTIIILHYRKFIKKLKNHKEGLKLNGIIRLFKKEQRIEEVKHFLELVKGDM